MRRERMLWRVRSRVVGLRGMTHQVGMTHLLGMTYLFGMTHLLVAALVFLVLLSGAAPSLNAQVTAQRLVDSAKEPQNWLMYSGDYAGRRFSALEQINTSNAASLVPRWAFHTMAGVKFETTPLVVDGILYGTGQDNRPVSLGARSGPA